MAHKYEGLGSKAVCTFSMLVIVYDLNAVQMFDNDLDFYGSAM